MNATANTPLQEFIALVFIAEREAMRDKPLSQSAQYRLRNVLKIITKALRRKPVVADLCDATYQATQFPDTGTKIRLFNDYFLALWRCACKHGILTEQPPGPGERWRKEEAELKTLRWSPEQVKIISTLPPQEAADALGVTIQAVYYARCNLRMLYGQPAKLSRGRWPRGCKPLSDAEGTLGHIMATKYFPRNQRIRKGKTKVAYDKALRDFRDSLGHEPTLADLHDEALEMFQVYLRDKSLAAKTINERVGRVTALWGWLAKKRMVDSFPAITPLQEQRRAPQAWTQEQLIKLFDACRREPGEVAGIPAWKWWLTLHHVLWDTGARIGEILALKWEWLDCESGFLTVPAEFRKGGMMDMVYNLHPTTLEMLRGMDEPSRELIFPWPKTPDYIYSFYNRILKRARLPRGRKDKFHRMRKSVASHLQAAGVDASQSLGHSSPTITRESYLDPTIVNTRKTHQVLFRPEGAKPSPAQASVAPQPVSVPSVQPATLTDIDAMAFL